MDLVDGGVWDEAADHGSVVVFPVAVFVDVAAVPALADVDVDSFVDAELAVDADAYD